MSKIRNNLIKKFEIILTHKKSIELEKEIYNYIFQKSELDGLICNISNEIFFERYLHKSRSIFNNLNPKSYIKNKLLLNKYLNNKINSYDLVRLKPHELFPKKWKNFNSKIKLLDKEICDFRPKATTDQFKCSKCKQRKCTYISVQIRSADEGCTNFITCVNCGNAWREG